MLSYSAVVSDELRLKYAIFFLIAVIEMYKLKYQCQCLC